MKNILLIILIIVLVPNIFFMALQLARENDEIHNWTSELSHDGIWVSSLNPVVKEIYFGKNISGFITAHSEDYSTWEITDLEIEWGEIEQRVFKTLEINGNIKNAKFYLLPSEEEINQFLIETQNNGGENSFFAPDARDNVILLLRKELPFEEFDALSKLGRFVSIEGVREKKDKLGVEEWFEFISISLSNKKI